MLLLLLHLWRLLLQEVRLAVGHCQCLALLPLAMVKCQVPCGALGNVACGVAVGTGRAQHLLPVLLLLLLGQLADQAEVCQALRLALLQLLLLARPLALHLAEVALLLLLLLLGLQVGSQVMQLRLLQVQQQQRQQLVLMLQEALQEVSLAQLQPPLGLLLLQLLLQGPLLVPLLVQLVGWLVALGPPHLALLGLRRVLQQLLAGLQVAVAFWQSVPLCRLQSKQAQVEHVTAMRCESDQAEWLGISRGMACLWWHFRWSQQQ